MDALQAANDFNLLISFLGKRDIQSLTKEALFQRYQIAQADLLILFGGSILHGIHAAAEGYQEGIAKRMMIVVGGEGHTTPYLREQIRKAYPHIQTDRRTEAELIAELFLSEYGISPNELLLETHSTNCGENAHFAFEMIKKEKIRPRHVILMQDTSMQRRMDASCQKEWERSDAHFIGYASYLPVIKALNGALTFQENDFTGLWKLDHFITLLLGEIPRLRDDANGYGPKGKGYIVHVDIPDQVLAAFERLSKEYETHIRKPWKCETYDK